jgi:hypothetical protein
MFSQGGPEKSGLSDPMTTSAADFTAASTRECYHKDRPELPAPSSQLRAESFRMKSRFILSLVTRSGFARDRMALRMLRR